MSKNIFFASLLIVLIFAGCSKKDSATKLVDISVSPIVALDSMHIKLDSNYVYQTCDSIPTLTSEWRDTGSIKITRINDNTFKITDSSGNGIQSYTYTATRAIFTKNSTYKAILFRPSDSIIYSTANPVNQMGGARGYFTMNNYYPYTNTATFTPFIEGFKKSTDTHDYFYKIK